LEAIAGVPGMVGGMGRHFRSLRSLNRDNGWIHHLLEEAENERIHLFVFLRLKNPGIFYRMFIVISQAVFFNFYFWTYLLFPKYAHRFVGYLEEEAVHTYTILINNLDKGMLPKWEKMKASDEAIAYWELEPEAKFRDVLLCIRADEAMHREVNHHFADIPADEEVDYEEIYVKSDVLKK